MESFSIPAPDFDLELTMTCGQTFCWHRLNGELYGSGPGEFYTLRNGEPVFVEQEGQALKVETALPEHKVRTALGLDHDLEEVFSRFPEDDALTAAKENFWGLRIVQDEFFPCLVSYLCSPQMRIPRIKQMHDEIARRYGDVVRVDGRELLRFPTVDKLAQATEEELREIGVGYRAEYIVETVDMLRDNVLRPEEIRGLDYVEARKALKQLHGVGDKVADCVLLFSLGFLEAAPIDTWADQALERHYPELRSSGYLETSKNLKDYFGENAGYAQEYLFHAARQGVIEV